MCRLLSFAVLVSVGVDGRRGWVMRESHKDFCGIVTDTNLSNGLSQ